MVLLYAAIAVLPTAAMYSLIVSMRAARRLGEFRAQQPEPEPIERIAARLRRLRAQLEATENQAGTTAKGHHVRVLRGAYVDVLAQACQRLDVPPPAGGEQARQADIYRTEAALRERGVDVRETAVR